MVSSIPRWYMTMEDSRLRTLRHFISFHRNGISTNLQGKGETKVPTFVGRSEGAYSYHLTMQRSSEEHRIYQALQTSIKQMIASSSSFRDIVEQHTLNGTFKKLCDDKYMQGILFPGTSPEILRTMPKNLRELLQWKDLEINKEKISKNAALVLHNIKEKGMKRGDIMDQETESILIPQIAQEALANGLVEAVRVLNIKTSNATAKLSLSVASVEAEQALRDQLDNSLLDGLFGLPGYAHQQHFMGADWAEAIAIDLERYCTMETMSIVNSSGSALLNPPSESSAQSASLLAATRMAWIEPDEVLCNKYPAVAELLNQLHALPYELNGKASLKNFSQQQMVLLEPAKGCTMLLHYAGNAQQLPRLDSRRDGGQLDSGIRVSCSYHVMRNRALAREQPRMSSGTDGQFVLAGCSGEAATSLPVQDDWLVLHQSATVRNERTAVCDSERDYFAVIFFIHGRDSGATPEA